MWPATCTGDRLTMNDLNKPHADVCVIGGGFMGASVALGLSRMGARVLMLDRVSPVHKASRANFGLVWSQSKGLGHPEYSRLSIQSVLSFKGFVQELEAQIGIPAELRLGAGLILSLGEDELDNRRSAIRKMKRQAEDHGIKTYSRMVDRDEIQEMIKPSVLGEQVTGGSFSRIDGDVNPLLLLRAMRRAFILNQGCFHQGCRVLDIQKNGSGWRIHTSQGKVEVPRVVLAAGLGSVRLASRMGVSIPVIPQKGQLLVTERLAPFLPFPMSGLRQAGNGSVMIGYTQENTGFETGTTASAARYLSRRALQAFPGLKRARVVRSWAGLRVLTKDGVPIYDEMDQNAFVLATHSCVTLAPVHARLLPDWIMGGPRPEDIHRFTLERFNV